MGDILRRLAKIAGRTFVVLLGLIVIGLAIASIVYSFEYVRRVLVMQESTVQDYLENFPMSMLEPSASPYFFEKSLDEEKVSNVFEVILEEWDFETFLDGKDTNAFIVIQDDKILYEKYFNGSERDSMMTSFSVAKSFTSFLVGAAVDDGSIRSIDDPITDYLPELMERDQRFEDITIRNLLLMASGLEYSEMRWGLFNGDDPITTYYPDQRKAAIEFIEVMDLPGEYFLYNKYHPQLLGLILERSTGVSVTEYTQTKLWDPVGMEFSGSWSLDSEESGFEKMEAGLNARTIDFAKLGRLYLENGDWDGLEVISADWIAESTTADPDHRTDLYYPDDFGQTLFHDLDGFYKFMWYGYFRDGYANDFAAEGDHGQFIYVSPYKDLIIVRNGTEYGEEWNWNQWIELFYQFASTF
jgi:CubicO group peptidase (beta-lactamase class C family)